MATRRGDIWSTRGWNLLFAEEEHLSENMQLILNEFSSVFNIPKELPPTKAYDHKIPLIDPNQSVCVRSTPISPEKMKKKNK